MRIKKTSQTTPIQAEVVNAYSESTINSYSSNYINNLTTITNHTITPINTGRTSSVQCYSILNKIIFISGYIVLPANISANTWLTVASIPNTIYPSADMMFDGIIRNADNGNSAGTTLIQITSTGDIKIKPTVTVTASDLLLSISYKI